MENKECIDKLKIYLSKQEPEIVYRLCANLMLDIHRWANLEKLDSRERSSLVCRTKENSTQLTNFIESKNSEKDLTLGHLRD